jgi:hypothetical protein
VVVVDITMTGILLLWVDGMVGSDLRHDDLAGCVVD